ncbi:hypothetical protein CHGG_00446 [Chaetomium globosum CBS 148.51]|uniref:DUF1917 domain-containing protein n=1 Tax=Chaetomium globosum (strain ATCC 6205 / CBS 148.51 / DSM 1962 / NBRC 6347 / NRRL 1970) TaxID=306901 RepID=Q2HH58_CHAGB|nr:uncharacterized protein CHGG_00446 [Chaetomium globosum CBS 148.51]EAQ92211.1 hypothetical protein CHGG_00446 [Chaetomium globosum CBS 148.51]
MDPDSDFYGDEGTTSAFKARVDQFDVVEWWDSRNVVTRHLQHAAHKQPAPTLRNGRLHNLYEGLPGAWQLSEPIECFLFRLPPSTTDLRPGLDWIYVANPYAPPGPGQAHAQFCRGGEERLALFAEFEQMATASIAKTSGSALTALKKEVANERRELVEDLRDLASACNIVTGKWMLFPEPERVDEIWAKVAMATVNGELGIAAKVATRVEAEKARLVCVYTSDFRDKDDVARVLNRMRELELVRPSGKQIYYKSAYDLDRSDSISWQIPTRPLTGTPKATKALAMVHED